MDVWMEGWTFGWVDGWWMDVWMDDKWMNGWMERLMDRWMDAWIRQKKLMNELGLPIVNLASNSKKFLRNQLFHTVITLFMRGHCLFPSMACLTVLTGNRDRVSRLHQCLKFHICEWKELGGHTLWQIFWEVWDHNGKSLVSRGNLLKDIYIREIAVGGAYAMVILGVWASIRMPKYTMGT